MLFYEAVRLIDAAVSAVSQPAKDAAQAGLNAAVAAGYTGGTAPNTVAAQQARIDAIVIASYDQIVNVAFGTTSPAVTGWNRLAPGASSGVIASGLLDASGTTTGIGLNVTDAGTGNSSNTALTSAIADVPSAVLSHTWVENNNGITVEVTGLDPAKLYTLQLTASRTTGSATAVRFVVNGVSRAPDIASTNNTTQILIVPNVAPSAGGVITVRAQRGAGSSFAYFTVMRVLRQA